MRNHTKMRENISVAEMRLSRARRGMSEIAYDGRLFAV